VARIAHPEGGILDFANVHLDPHRGDEGEMNRDQETMKLLDLLAREDDCRPTILTGDLNSTDKGRAMGRLRAARFEDSWVKANRNAIGNTAMIELETGAFEQHPRRRIDFILARPAGDRTLTPLRSEVVFRNQDGKGFYPSDHYGVFTTFDAKL
jgi:endonuclease/exonuclease/phosphatase family metal-dependent hydrolase